MGVGLEMAPLIKEFIAKLIFNFKLEDEIASLPSSASISTSTLADPILVWRRLRRPHKLRWAFPQDL